MSSSALQGCTWLLGLVWRIEWVVKQGEPHSALRGLFSTLHFANSRRALPHFSYRAPLSSLTNLTALLGLVVPVLRSLTESTSDNTIGPLSGLCFAINLALADHSRRPPPGTISSSSSSQGSSTTLRATLSLNGAVAGSTILASRLQSNLEAFALLFLAIGWFGALPMVKKRNDSVSPSYSHARQSHFIDWFFS